jgi:hypothetical protein
MKRMRMGNTSEPAERSVLQQHENRNTAEPALRSPFRTGTGGKLSPPSEPSGLRLPLRTRLISRSLARRGAGLTSVIDDGSSSDDHGNEPCTAPGALRGQRPRRGGCGGDREAGSDQGGCPKDSPLQMRFKRRPQSGLRCVPVLIRFIMKPPSRLRSVWCPLRRRRSLLCAFHRRRLVFCSCRRRRNKFSLFIVQARLHPDRSL